MDAKPAELTLVNGQDVIRIRPRAAHSGNPVFCTSWDLGAPEVRYTQVPNPGADGVTESPGFLGARTVTLELRIKGGADPITGDVHDAYWYANKLIHMAHPRSQPVLQISRIDELSGGKVWQMALRGDPWQMPISKESAALLNLTLSFVCPGGLIDGDLQCFTTPAAGQGNIDLDFPMSFPTTFGADGNFFPRLTMNVGGDATVTPTIYISGPVKDPEIRSGDDRFRFHGLTLTAGQTVQIDMGTGNVRLGSDGTIYDDMSAYNTVDWAVSSFWQWEPGVHDLEFLSTTGAAQVQYRERRLSI